MVEQADAAHVVRDLYGLQYVPDRITIGIQELLGLGRSVSRLYNTVTRTYHPVIKEDAEITYEAFFDTLQGNDEQEIGTQSKMIGDICMRWIVSSPQLQEELCEAFPHDPTLYDDPLLALHRISRSSEFSELQSYVHELQQRVIRNDKSSIEVAIGLNHFIEWIRQKRQDGFVFLGARMIDSMEFPGDPTVIIRNGMCDAIAIELKDGIKEADEVIKDLHRVLFASDNKRKIKTGISAHEVVRICELPQYAYCIKRLEILEFKQGSQKYYNSKVQTHRKQLSIYAGILLKRLEGEPIESALVTQDGNKTVYIQKPLIPENKQRVFPIEGRLAYFSTSGVEETVLNVDVFEMTPELCDRAFLLRAAETTLIKLKEISEIQQREEVGPDSSIFVSERLQKAMDVHLNFYKELNDLVERFRNRAMNRLSVMVSYPLSFVDLYTSGTSGREVNELITFAYMLALSFATEWKYHNFTMHQTLEIIKTYQQQFPQNTLIDQFIKAINSQLNYVWDDYFCSIEELQEPSEDCRNLIEYIFSKQPYAIKLDDFLELVGHDISPDGSRNIWRCSDGTLMIPFFNGEFDKEEGDVLMVLPPRSSHVFFFREKPRRELIRFMEGYPQGIPVVNTEGTLVLHSVIARAIKDHFGSIVDMDNDRTPFVLTDLGWSEMLSLNEGLSTVLQNNFSSGESVFCQNARLYLLGRRIPIGYAINYGVVCTSGLRNDLSSVGYEGVSLYEDKEILLQLGLAKGSIWTRITRLLRGGMVGLPLTGLFKTNQTYGFSFRMIPEHTRPQEKRPHRSYIARGVLQEDMLYIMSLGDLEASNMVFLCEGAIDSLTARLLYDSMEKSDFNICVIGTVGINHFVINHIVTKIRERYPHKAIVLGYDRDSSVEGENGLLQRLTDPHLIRFWTAVENVWGPLPDVSSVKDMNDLWCKLLVALYDISVDEQGARMSEDDYDLFNRDMTKLILNLTQMHINVPITSW